MVKVGTRVLCFDTGEIGEITGMGRTHFSVYYGGKVSATVADYPYGDLFETMNGAAKFRIMDPVASTLRPVSTDLERRIIKYARNQGTMERCLMGLYTVMRLYANPSGPVSTEFYADALTRMADGIREVAINLHPVSTRLDHDNTPWLTREIADYDARNNNNQEGK